MLRGNAAAVGQLGMLFLLPADFLTFCERICALELLACLQVVDVTHSQENLLIFPA